MTSSLASVQNSIFKTEWYEPDPSWNQPHIVNMMNAAFCVRDKFNMLITSENPVQFHVIICAKPHLFDCLKVWPNSWQHPLLFPHLIQPHFTLSPSYLTFDLFPISRCSRMRLPPAHLPSVRFYRALMLLYSPVHLWSSLMRLMLWMAHALSENLVIWAAFSSSSQC